MYCKFCGKECKNGNSLRNHQRLCKENPDRQESNFKYIKDPWNKGLTKEDPRVAKAAERLSKALKGKPSKTVWTDEMRKAKSEWRKQLHIDHPETHPNRRLAGNRKKMSYPEKVAHDFLVASEIEFEHNKMICGYYPDFVIGNTIIEIDGARWHDKERDSIRDKVLCEAGYFVFRIDSKEHIEDRIKEILSVRC
jgi:very-short-patch-repair endonuclease